MQKKKIGIITFAITLISLGILLLIRNFMDINLKTVFAIAWPSIIILFGIEIIITKLILSRNTEEIKTYIDPLSVIMLSIIIVIVSVYSSFSLGKGLNFFSIIKSIDFEDFSRSTLNYKDVTTYEYSFTIDSKDKDELKLINSFGDVDIIESSTDNIEIDTEIKINYNDKEYADELSKNLVKIDEGGKIISVLTDLGSKYDKDKAGNISVSYDIRMPAHIKANIENEFGDTTVRNLEKDVEINSQHGNIEVEDILGALRLKNSFGSIQVTDVKGNVDIENQHGSIHVTDIKGNTDIENQHSSVYVENIEKDASIKNQFGKVDAINVGGSLNIESEHANVDVEYVKGDLYIYDKFGNITVEGANKFIKIISNNGNISFRTDEIIEKGMEIENEFGNVDITVPLDQSGSFNVLTEFGEIKSKLGLRITEGITEQSINDFINNTNTKFYIRSKNGNINLYTN